MVSVAIYNDDVNTALSNYKEDSFSAVFCDPPYGLVEGDFDTHEVLESWLKTGEYTPRKKGFMSEEWDSFVPSPTTWREIRRRCKPGAILVAFCGTKMVDFMSISIRLGGWTKFDEIDILSSQISWLYSSGMPKSSNISSFIDKREGNEGEVIARYKVSDKRNGHGRAYGSSLFAYEKTGYIEHVKRAPVSEDAKTWKGYGTALNPAHEVVLLFRSPAKESHVDCALKYGTSALNIDASRFGDVGINGEKLWPKNVIGVCCDDYPFCYDCPIVALNNQANLSNQQLPSKYFYVSKVGTKERFAGVENNNTRHPTAKPIALCKYLARMIAPPENIAQRHRLLVPFCGSGSEIIGAMLGGWKNIVAIEREEKYVDLAIRRLTWWENQMRLTGNNEKIILENMK